MDRRTFLSLTLASVALPQATFAQGAKVERIGLLTAQRAGSLEPYLGVVRSALAELGRVEGRNLIIEYRYGDEKIERVPELAAQLVRLPVSVIVAQGASVPVIKTLDLPVPIVYVTSGDPVSAGLADSLARPRGNMTGLTFMAAEFNSKRIELLHELVPNLRRVALLGHPEHPGEHIERAYTEEAAKRLDVTIAYYPTRTREDLDRALAAIDADRPQAISVFSDGFAVQHRQTIMDFGTSRRIPIIAGWAVFAQAGALCSFGPRLVESYRRIAYYVDRILKGAKPADLPIEQPTHFELVVNLRTARALGLTLPQSVLARADEVIE